MIHTHQNLERERNCTISFHVKRNQIRRDARTATAAVKNEKNYILFGVVLLVIQTSCIKFMICFSPNNQPNRNVVAKLKTASYRNKFLGVCVRVSPPNRPDKRDEMRFISWCIFGSRHSYCCCFFSDDVHVSAFKIKKNPVFPSNLKRLR